VAGLAPANLRLDQPEPEDDGDQLIILDADTPDLPSEDGLSIEIGDGSVIISLDGKRLDGADNDDAPGAWYDNLVDKIDASELSRIADDLLRGVDDDLQSRKEWTETVAEGIKLLGLQIEVPNVAGASDGAPVEGMSRVRHPLLLEAALRFQANARSEMLPTDGPVKIRNDDNNADLDEDELANALEKDFNHFLTSVATEYYPDTDRMLLKFGVNGIAFKKVYFCPLRNRPVSETVDANDLIVNNAATDLGNAKRITHRVMMRPSTVKRLQILGVYRDISLSLPTPSELDTAKREEAAQQGVDPESMRPEDRDREIYEVCCELDIVGFEHKYKREVSGLEIPYRVTIDVSSREILSIVRNYAEDSKELPVAREMYVSYIFVPGFGFYSIGLLHILGNTTNALTASWRLMLDNGMFSNFPGFLMADTGARQNTNIFRVPPGGGALVKTGGQPINQAVMPLPYNTSGQAALQSLTESITETGQRVGGTAELQVGEGKQDAPVGTTLAMIDQATKITNSVHKRMHASQAKEFQLMADCFRENPESFWQRKGRSGYPWDKAKFLKALTDYELVPQADPNTSSYTQRVMKVVALKQAQASSPNLYIPLAVERAVLMAVGWGNPNQFLVSADQAAQPPPEIIKGEAEIANQTKTADARMLDAQSNAEKVKQEGLAAANANGKQEDTPVDVLTAKAKMLDAETKAKGLGVQAHSELLEDQNRDQDRQSHEKIAALDIAREVISKAMDLRQAEKDIPRVEAEVGEKSK
jgi:hypothetical protein